MSLPWSSPRPRRVAIVGAGVAGLTCARLLLRAGYDVQVYESETEVGGRVRTATTPNGYRIDRGFQVLFAGYPALLRAVRLSDLAPRYIPAGVRVMSDRGEFRLSHPLFRPAGLLDTVRSAVVQPTDIAAIGRLAVASAALGDSALQGTGLTTAEWLESRSGLSGPLRDLVMRPLFAGVSLDPALSSDATFFQFVARYFGFGRVFLPALGVGELPRRLAAGLPPERLHLGLPVSAVRPGEGVQVNGRWETADAIVVATDLPSASRLAEVELDAAHRSSTTVYLASQKSVIEDGMLLLNATAGGVVNHALQLTSVSRDYAPPGRHLLSATILGEAAGGDEDVVKTAIADLKSWYPPAARTTLEPIAVVRVPFAQFAQKPGIYRALPTAWTTTPGLYLAGEYLHSSSVQGAFRGGELAAAAVCADQGE